MIVVCTVDEVETFNVDEAVLPGSLSSRLLQSFLRPIQPFRMPVMMELFEVNSRECDLEFIGETEFIP